AVPGPAPPPRAARLALRGAGAGVRRTAGGGRGDHRDGAGDAGRGRAAGRRHRAAAAGSLAAQPRHLGDAGRVGALRVPRRPGAVRGQAASARCRGGRLTVLVVTGTGTGVGKTVATAAVAAVAGSHGRTVAVVKPAQTGTGSDEPGDVATVLALA